LLLLTYASPVTPCKPTPIAGVSHDILTGRDVRSRLRAIVTRATDVTRTEHVMNAFVSTLNPNGRTPEDMWGCIYPGSAPNKSYSLQVALIISADGAELCLCLGSGTSQVRDVEERQDGERYLRELQRTLGSIPDEVVRAVEVALPDGVRFLDKWRRPSGAGEFSNLRAWLMHAAGESGVQASVSWYLTPDELERLGGGIFDAYEEMADAAAPLFDYIADGTLPIASFDLDSLRQRASSSPHNLHIDDDVYRAVMAAVQSGRHIILTGPPGTAKTTLAEVLCGLATDAGHCSGYTLTTATADWTTYETIGGLRPSSSGSELRFHPGIFLESAKSRRWLIVDELNRANFDRAFGQLFTLLSGQSVVLPYEDSQSGKKIVLAIEGRETRYQANQYSIVAVPPAWRIIATMNVFDKSLLFEMSYALMRRFAFIEVPAPETAVYQRIWSQELDGLPKDLADQISAVLADLENLRKIKQIGPAIFRDMAKFARSYANDGTVPTQALAFQLFYSFLLPQFEGIDQPRGRKLYQVLAPLVGASRLRRLESTLHDVLQVTLSASDRDEPVVGGGA